ncbi:MAG TPA: hypothetical protein VLV50_12230 [Stellaceae bacterium]|nr:hypothetical protein [Stellaceae bacterium]
MRQVTAFPLFPLSFRSRHGANGPTFSLWSSLRRWRRHASLAAIAHAFCDASFNPYLFQIEDRGEPPKKSPATEEAGLGLRVPRTSARLAEKLTVSTMVV